MDAKTRGRLTRATILTHLDGAPCPDCGGVLVRGRYDGDPAVVCAACGTPVVRLY